MSTQMEKKKEKINSIEKIQARRREFFERKYDARSSKNFKDTENVFRLKRPITFLYYFSGEAKFKDELMDAIKFVAGPIFRIDLKNIEIFGNSTTKYKITVGGNEKDLNTVKENLDRIFAYYTEDYDIQIGR